MRSMPLRPTLPTRWRRAVEPALRDRYRVIRYRRREYAGSTPRFTEFRDLFHAWLPHTEGDVMPGAKHLLHMRHPADAAARLANFLKRHAVAV